VIPILIATRARPWLERLREALNNQLPDAATDERSQTTIEEQTRGALDDYLKATERPTLYEKGPTRTQREMFIREMRLLYPVRMRRLARDMKTLRKEAARRGIEMEGGFGDLL
jgi:hypothetical protein